jgi:multiple sugar transport system permease protein
MEHVSSLNGSEAAPVAASIPVGRRTAGRWLIGLATVGLAFAVAIQALYAIGMTGVGFETWRPVLYAFVGWGVALGAGQVMARGEAGHRALFLLPALLFTIALVIFPTFFGLYLAFTDWNLSSPEGLRFNGLANLYALLNDRFYWGALGNMVFYVLSVLVQYAVAFGLALLLNADIRARKFFRVTFLLPFMLSPVAVSWMIGKSLMEYRFGPAANLARLLGWSSPSFFTDPWI